ncbi:hypothetical protein D9613_004001 [Agrocybe pediades]|uniref:Uncharacterized protein n=1 Tax=Agrocybe pediades TaxID=84607 RepID=A0A8H4QJB5_9AGAR|nr:hypothetical protein D9613_004001 [Agrocybe pediades]
MKLLLALFAFLGLLFPVSALPSPIRLSLNELQKRSATLANSGSLTSRNDLFPRDDEPIFEEYFGRTFEITEREWEENAMEKRYVAQAARFIIKGVLKIVDLIKGKINQDKEMRGKWTSEMIGKLRSKYPHFNFVVCHTKHNYEFKGQRGRDWGHSHQELPVSFHKTVGYEIYWFKEGIFRRTGDGGFLNWAFGGNIKKRENKNSVITFGPP